MFILAPLMLIVASVMMISVIVFRKMPYLNKLTPESHPGGNVLDDLFPELSDVFENLKFKEYGNLWLIELEKFLRRLRVVSLKMDRISDSWIKKIRSGNISRATISAVTDKKEVIDFSVPQIQSSTVVTIEDLKKEEQRLIIEIAKNPKDTKLYEVLGDLYVKMNSFSDAKESFEAAIELSPHNEHLKQKLSLVLGKLGSQN